MKQSDVSVQVSRQLAQIENRLLKIAGLFYALESDFAVLKNEARGLERLIGEEPLAHTYKYVPSVYFGMCISAIQDIERALCAYSTEVDGVGIGQLANLDSLIRRLKLQQ